MNKDHLRELTKCCESFPYFCETYVKILDPLEGLVPLGCKPWQKRLAQELDENRFVISTKWRNGGLMTTTLVYMLWQCLTKCDKRIMWLERRDVDAMHTGEVIDNILHHLPKWMRPHMGKKNRHEKHFSDTGSRIVFYSPEPARGRALDFLVINDAAFIPKLDQHWKALWPTLSCGGCCAVISTPNYSKHGAWFNEIMIGASQGQNKFHIFKSRYTEHEMYQDKETVTELQRIMGLEGFRQEFEQSLTANGLWVGGCEPENPMSEVHGYAVEMSGKII